MVDSPNAERAQRAGSNHYHGIHHITRFDDAAIDYE
jgi:hypothetical protein